MLQRSNLYKLSSGTVTPLTETAIYRFCVAFAVFVFVADPIISFGQSDYTVIIKYVYTSIILLLIVLSFARWNSFDTSSLSPILALGFFFITGGAFLTNFLLYGVKESYVTAFTASLIFAASAFVPSRAIMIDSRRILTQMLWLLSFGSVCYFAEIVLKVSDASWWPSTYSRDVAHIKSAVCVLAICLCILLDRKLLATALVTLTGLTLIFRPTSSLVILLTVCAPLAVGMRLRAINLSRLAVYGILFVAAAAPIVLYFYFDEAAQFIQDFESYIKADLLGGQSNTAFRLTIMKYALQALDQSFLFGNGLSGDTAVLLAREYSWWLEANSGNGMAVIHSDFVIVLTQAGFVGYTLFMAFFYSMLSMRFRMLTESAPYDKDSKTLVGLAIIAIVILIIDCSFNPFLLAFYAAHPIWMLLFISEMTRKAMPMTEFATQADHTPAFKLKFARQEKWKNGRAKI